MVIVRSARGATGRVERDVEASDDTMALVPSDDLEPRRREYRSARANQAAHLGECSAALAGNTNAAKVAEEE